MSQIKQMIDPRNENMFWKFVHPRNEAGVGPKVPRKPSRLVHCPLPGPAEIVTVAAMDGAFSVGQELF